MLQTRSTTRVDHGRSAPRDGRGARRGLPVFAVGLVLLPVGIGLGLPHVAKTGLQPLAVAGLLAWSVAWSCSSWGEYRWSALVGAGPGTRSRFPPF